MDALCDVSQKEGNKEKKKSSLTSVCSARLKKLHFLNTERKWIIAITANYLSSVKLRKNDQFFQ